MIVYGSHYTIKFCLDFSRIRPYLNLFWGYVGVSTLNSYHIFERGSKAAFSSNSNFVVYSIKPQFDTVRSKKLKKVKKDKLPKDSLGIYYFETGKTYKFPGLSKISVPKKSSDWVAVLIEDVERSAENSNFPDIADRNPWEKFIKIYHKYVVEQEVV